MNNDVKDFLAKAAGLYAVVFGVKTAQNIAKQILALVWFVLFACCMGFILLVINFSF